MVIINVIKRETQTKWGKLIICHLFKLHDYPLNVKSNELINMKIAIWHNLPSGGKRALYNHVKALKERGHYLEAWTTDLNMDYLPLKELIIEHSIPLAAKIGKTFKIKSPILRNRQKIKVLKEHCALCAEEIEKRGFDIILANSCVYSYISYISLFSSIPTAIYLGEPFRLLYEAFPDNIWQAPSFGFNIRNLGKFRRDFELTYARRVQVREEINAASAYDSILVNSLYSKESILRAYGIEPRVCYLGVDESKFIFKQNQKEPYVVGLGKISDSKSVNKTIIAVSRIIKSHRPVIKWISNGYDQSYLDYIIELAKKSDVTFQPLVSIDDEELINVLGKAAVMIYTPKLEPFGLAPLEANMCGTYVIAVAEGGIRESIINNVNGTLFPANETQVIADEMEKFISNLDFAFQKGNEARIYTEDKWSFKAMGDNIEKELYSVINSALKD